MWAGKDREDLAAWELGTSARKVEKAAKNGCQICELLYNGLRELIPNIQDEAIIIIFCPGDVLRLQVGNMDGEATRAGNSTPSLELEFYTHSGKDLDPPVMMKRSDKCCRGRAPVERYRIKND